MDRAQLQDTPGGPVLFGKPLRMKPRRWVREAAEAHLWCARCTRTFPNGLQRRGEQRPTCPYADCNGDLAADAIAHSTAWAEGGDPALDERSRARRRCTAAGPVKQATRVRRDGRVGAGAGWASAPTSRGPARSVAGLDQPPASSCAMGLSTEKRNMNDQTQPRDAQPDAAPKPAAQPGDAGPTKPGQIPEPMKTPGAGGSTPMNDAAKPK